VLFLAERIIKADYTQDAEAAAGTFAHTALLGADLPPSAIATFFSRLALQNGKDAGIMELLISYPALGDRIAAEHEGANFRPVLIEPEWDALRMICD
jgi:predicted Zn-dependent protease